MNTTTPSKITMWAATSALVIATLAMFGERDLWMAEDPVIRPPAPPPQPPPAPVAPQQLTPEQAMQHIAPFEGRRTRVYRDSRKIKTIGVGHNLQRGKLTETRLRAVGANPSAVKRGLVELSDRQIDQLFHWDTLDAMAAAKRLQPGFDQMPAAAQAVVVDLVFNMGPTGYAQRLDFRRLLMAGRWADAATVLMRDAWARSHLARAQANAQTLVSVD